jgi:hypothetical protein
MRRWHLTLFVCGVFLGHSSGSRAQTVYGSTHLDIDADTGSVTATCETDLDTLTEEYYKAGIECTVKDHNGKVIASEEGWDAGARGFVQVVLTFTGVPGETYKAVGGHLLNELYTVECNDEPPPPFGVPYYEDVYDFNLFADVNTFNKSFEFVSPRIGDRRMTSDPYHGHNCHADSPESSKPMAQGPKTSLNVVDTPVNEPTTKATASCSPGSMHESNPK